MCLSFNLIVHFDQLTAKGFSHSTNINSFKKTPFFNLEFRHSCGPLYDAI